MNFDDLDLPPPPPEFADSSSQRRSPPLRQSRSTFSTAANSPPIEDKKFIEEYYCDLTRNEALEALESVQMDGAYIVRPGTTSPFCISFLHCGEAKHVKIHRDKNGQYFLGDSKVEISFDTMSQLMDYLTKNVIQGVNGVVFRLIINAKPCSERLKERRSDPDDSPPPPAPSAFQSQSPPPQSPPQDFQINGRSDTGRRGSTLSSFGGGSGGKTDFSTASTMPMRPSTGFSVASPTAQSSEKLASRSRSLNLQPYFADMRRDQAEAQLMNTRIEGQFIVRPSKASAYCLSVFHRGRVVHLKIVCVANRFVLEQLLNDGQTFTQVPDLIDSLTMNRRVLTLMNGDCIVLRPID